MKCKSGGNLQNAANGAIPKSVPIGRTRVIIINVL